jgi:periplasmic protein CpxP/Spy
MNLFSIGRTIAVATVAGALALGTASAQTAGTTNKTQSGKPPAAAAATSTKPETVEQRIAALKTALKITPDQESKWNDVAKAMRENAAAMEKVVQEKKGKMSGLNAVDDLKTYQEFSQVRLDGLKNLISAFSTLYDSMTPEQKKNADHVFDSYGPPRAQKQG